MTSPKTPPQPFSFDDLAAPNVEVSHSLDDLAIPDDFGDLGDVADVAVSDELAISDDLGDLGDLGDLSDIHELADLGALAEPGDVVVSAELLVSDDLGEPPPLPSMDAPALALSAPPPPVAQDPAFQELRRKLRRRDLTIQALRRDLALLQLNAQDDLRARMRDVERERDALRDLEATHLQAIRRLQEDCEVLREIEQTQQETIDRLQDRNDELRKQAERLTQQLSQRASADPDVAALHQQLQDLTARLAFKRDEHTHHVETIEAEHARKQEKLRAEIERLRAERDLSQQALFEVRASLEGSLRALSGLLATTQEP